MTVNCYSVETNEVRNGVMLVQRTVDKTEMILIDNKEDALRVIESLKRIVEEGEVK